MTEIELKARAWDNLMAYFTRNRTNVSLREARRLVGGSAHLDNLLASGQVKEVETEPCASNSKRLFPAKEIFCHIRRVKY